MELYQYALPEVLRGKKLLYLHGFASSGESGTVASLRLLLPGASILAPDLPVDSEQCLRMLLELCSREKPDLILGTSMGAMYALLLRGYDRIAVNPALHINESIQKNNGLGKVSFHSPRKDGETSFLVTKGLLEQYRKTCSKVFEGMDPIEKFYPSTGAYGDDRDRVWGLFATHDTVVDGYDEFSSFYPNAIHYEGEHYLNDRALLHSVLPMIERIDHMRDGKERKTVLVSFEDTVCDSLHGRQHGKEPLEMEPVNGALKALVELSHRYEVYILASAVPEIPLSWSIPESWCSKWLGVLSWGRVIVSSRKDMVLGDYLIERYPERYGCEDFMGTVIPLGSDTFKDWESVLSYFSALGGQ